MVNEVRPLDGIEPVALGIVVIEILEQRHQPTHGFDLGRSLRSPGTGVGDSRPYCLPESTMVQSSRKCVVQYRLNRTIQLLLVSSVFGRRSRVRCM